MYFDKLHGAGNDFILVDSVEAGWADRAEELCARRTGIGADGLVIVSRLSADPVVVDVAVFNRDGSVGPMCGNALRCVAWVVARDSSVAEMTLIMSGVEHQARVDAAGVWVTAEVGEVHSEFLRAEVDGHTMWFDSAYTGTEHMVTIVENVDEVDVVRWGRVVRHDRALPLGANVNFIEAVGPRELKIRTYERGVEQETLSCGSGAVAAAAIASTRDLLEGDGQITVHNRSGTPLLVRPHSVRTARTRWLGGPVTHVFSGRLT
ncbi:diaminopimelate epimerase [Nocardia ninae]|uniref:Diaminopimelate epimerase n=2 Tax=Nocardia ninae TaxID=356145 RepID=A0A511M9V4_9NOCA|nr:diaminopimelate epimerase [Nocardia ninae NBRC 108245]